VSRLGRQDGDPLVVDLSERRIRSSSELWDALSEPCGLPDWFGRNLDAWWDTIDTGAISDVIDAHPRLIVRLSPVGMFQAGDPQGEAFVEVTTQSDYAMVEFADDLAAG